MDGELVIAAGVECHVASRNQTRLSGDPVVEQTMVHAFAAVLEDRCVAIAYLAAKVVAEEQRPLLVRNDTI